VWQPWLPGKLVCQLREEIPPGTDRSERLIHTETWISLLERILLMARYVELKFCGPSCYSTLISGYSYLFLVQLPEAFIHLYPEFSRYLPTVCHNRTGVAILEPYCVCLRSFSLFGLHEYCVGWPPVNSNASQYNPCVPAVWTCTVRVCIGRRRRTLSKRLLLRVYKPQDLLLSSCFSLSFSHRGSSHNLRVHPLSFSLLLL
jgi:hypothetical protein